MRDTLDPDELLAQLQDAAGDPPLTPLRIGTAPQSTRTGLVGRATDRVRSLILRLLSPVIGDLLLQLERDRHRQRAEIQRLSARVDELERDAENSR